MSTPQAPSASHDEELLGRARAGHAPSFEVVYRRRYPVVLAFLAKRVAEPELAADLLAETFAALFVLVRDPQRPLPESAVAWLLLTARHLLIDSYRRGQVESAARRRLAMRPVVLEDADLVRVQEISAEISLVEELAAQLPPEQVQALCARVLDERDYPSIAGELRCSEAVVRKRVSRALRTLRRNAVEANNHV
jgi:RNA polymerase sigma-70 factor (ECF subfamily)